MGYFYRWKGAKKCGESLLAFNYVLGLYLNVINSISEKLLVNNDLGGIDGVGVEFKTVFSLSCIQPFCLKLKLDNLKIFFSGCPMVSLPLAVAHKGSEVNVQKSNFVKLPLHHFQNTSDTR